MTFQIFIKSLENMENLKKVKVEKVEIDKKIFI